MEHCQVMRVGTLSMVFLHVGRVRSGRCNTNHPNESDRACGQHQRSLAWEWLTLGIIATE